MVNTHYVFDSGYTDEPNSPTFITARTPFIARFKVFSVTVPLTFYTTGRQNKTVALREQNKPNEIRYVTVPPGNYNAATFPVVLQTSLGGSYRVTYDETQRNLNIENPNVMCSVLGFTGGTTMFDQIGMTRTGESEVGYRFQGGVSNSNGTSSLLLVSGELSSRDLMVANNEAINALALIELCEQPQTFMKWENPGGYLVMGQNLKYIRFRFLDARTLRDIDFRGGCFTVQLGVLTDFDDPVSY